MPVSRVIATFRIGGFHHWKDALHMAPSVGYLQHPHRHLFTFRIECKPDHDDRAIEFHLLRERAKSLVMQMRPERRNWEIDFGEASCEAIARELGSTMRGEAWPVCAVEVWEDDENGARIEWVTL